MTFQIDALPLEPFQPLFVLDDAALEALGARRMITGEPHSAPCRVSLIDAAPGETLILTNHAHLMDAGSPYRAGGPIFVREAATRAVPAPDEVPEMVASRLLSVRVYDIHAMMTDADVVEGRDLALRLTAWFDQADTAVIHLHTARRGCFMAAARRA